MKARLTISVLVLSALAALAAWGFWQHNHQGITPGAFSLPGDCQMCSSPAPIQGMTPDTVPTLPRKDKVPNDFFPMAQKHSFNTQPF
ncbi:MAG TPA: hypothetical protein V6C81_21475 [Planktothrix sp.]